MNGSETIGILTTESERTPAPRPFIPRAQAVGVDLGHDRRGTATDEVDRERRPVLVTRGGVDQTLLRRTQHGWIDARRGRLELRDHESGGLDTDGTCADG